MNDKTPHASKTALEGKAAEKSNMIQSASSLKEEQILEFWEKNKIFEKSITQRRKKKPFVFFEGPPSANGKPGIHHAISRSFKDLICRYKTMRGFLVERKGGWDTHGLPIEIQTEKELGFTQKQDIENYGIDKFNKKAQEIVWQYKDEWERFTKRIGFWLDINNPYITYNNNYIESLWWILKQIWERKLLYKDYKVVHYCPRCGTALSSHEVAQGYDDVTELSVYVKFRIPDYSFANKGKGETGARYFLAWTTTPWTLPGNVALAVGAEIDYVEIKVDNNFYVLAKERLGIMKEQYVVVKNHKGKDLAGTRYEPLFRSVADAEVENIQNAFQVYTAEFVNTQDGTGIVHTAVMYGEEDFKLGEKVGLPKFHTVDENGRFKKEVKEFAGQYVKDANKDIIQFLNKNNSLYKEEAITHAYPFCWRCKTPLLYYAKSTWFIKMTKVKKDLMGNNKKINWVPAHLKDGRFGEWLKEIKDWALSRERYWGTPLPVWQCGECGHLEMVGALKELHEKRYFKNNFFLLRHGQADHNVKGLVGPRDEMSGQESKLTAKGIRQVVKAAKILKKYHIDVIVASDIYRIRQTAKIVSEEIGKPIMFCEELRELNLGSHQTITEKEYHSLFGSEVEWFTKKIDPAAENHTDLKKRMWSFIQKTNRDYNGKNILVISHGDPLWILESMSKNLSNSESLKYHKKYYIKNGELRKMSLFNYPYNQEGEVDVHRPYIDEVVLRCTKCQAPMRRVKEVIDVWFDSGAMPFAQWHYPFENKNTFKKSYPADYIAEGIDQTRGWFYTLLAIATLLKKGAPYKNVISVGHILDEKGEKMSKSKGNVVDPWYIVNRYSNDALRWYLFTVNSPGEPKRFREKDIADRLNKFIATVENTAKFFELYSAKRIPANGKISFNPKKLSMLDRWILSRLYTLVKETTDHLDQYEVFKSARAIDEFVDDLSNWYIRRSRRRFQRPENKEELNAASSVLGLVLLETSKVIAPFVPFVAESVYQRVKVAGGMESVHLTEYPKTQGKLIHKQLESQMKEARNIVALGLNLRVKAGIKVRQPLREIKVRNYELRIKDNVLRNQISEIMKEELNVQSIGSIKDVNSLDKKWLVETNGELTVVLDTEITTELQKQGLARELIRQIQEIRKEAKYNFKDTILVRWSSESSDIESVFEELGNFVKQEVIARDITEVVNDRERKFDIQKQMKVNGREVWIGIVKI